MFRDVLPEGIFCNGLEITSWQVSHSDLILDRKANL
jgi:hypothetical protein